VQAIKFWPWNNSSYNSQHSEYSFDTVSDNGKFTIIVSLCYAAALWHVEAVNIHDQNYKQTYISVDPCK